MMVLRGEGRNESCMQSTQGRPPLGYRATANSRESALSPPQHATTGWWLPYISH